MQPKTISVLIKPTGRHCVVVGDDASAEEWAQFLIAHDAHVRLVHPQVSEALKKDTPSQAHLEVLARGFLPEDLADCDLLIVCLSDETSCETIAKSAGKEQGWRTFTHFPEKGNVFLPQVLGLESLQLLLPFSAAAPPSTEKISRSWHRFLPEDFIRLVQFFKKMEKKVEAVVLDRRYRGKVFDTLFESHLSQLLCDGKWEAAEALVDKVLQSFAQNPARRQRISPRVGAQFHIQFFAQEAAHTAKIFNLSRDGVFIATRSSLPKLTHVTHIKFSLPHGLEIKDAEGFVVWENSMLNPQVPIYPPGFAVMFDSLSPENVAAIDRYVESQLK
ncbi:MAG: NAD(P)-dependent oxidoreductase [Acidobacteriia bacterium]|nr:NAD(P)-dependent oxidoreductase [Terriglobia bacterium]